MRRQPALVLAAALGFLSLAERQASAQCSAIRVSPQTLPAATAGTPYNQTVTQTGGAPGTTFSISAGALPAGLSLNPTTGDITGTPAAGGPALFTVRATEPLSPTGTGCFGGRTYRLTVSCATITVTPPAVSNGTAGLLFSQTFTQSGGALPVTFSLASGTLPSGIALAASGLLSGTTTQSGSFPITVTATDTNGCTGTSGTYTLTIVPAAVSETYPQTVVGNMGVDTSTGTVYSVLTNDVGTGLSANLLGGGTTAQGGNVTLNGATGTLTYDPPRGFEGADSFQYTVTGAGGTSGPATVTLNVSGVVWFVDAAAAPGGNGRRSAPYDTLAAFAAVNNGTGSNPAANDRVFLFENAASYTGSLTLLDGQRLIGQDATGLFAAAVGYTVPDTTLNVPVLDSANGIKATITNAGNAVVLATGTGNTVRGLTVDVSAGAAISGTGALGTATANEVALATSGTAAGLSLTNQSGTLTFSNGSIGGNGSAAGVLVSGGSGLVQVLASTVAKTGGRLVDVQSKTGGGVSFSTGSLSVTGAATDAVVLLNNASTQVDFAAGFAVTTTNGRGLVVDNSATTTFGGSGSTISATGGAALDVSGTNFLGNAAFASASSTNSSAEGIRLVNVSGNVVIAAGAISGSTGAAFLVSGGSSNLSYAGTVSKTNAGRAVDVQARAGGTVTLSGAVTATGPSAGILVSGPTAASTVAFTGTVDLGTGVTRLTGGTPLTVDHNAQPGAVTSFSTLNVLTSGQAGVDAANGGTLNVAAGLVDAGGRAIRANGIALGVTLSSITSAGSAAEGVSLVNASGSLTSAVTTVTNPSTQGILVSGSSVNATFTSTTTTVSGTGTQRILVATSTGNVSFGSAVLSGGTDAVSLQNNSAGTRSFTGISASGNSGIGFLHAVGGGAVSVTGPSTFTNPGGTGVDIQSSASAVTFAGVTVNKGATAGTGVSLASNTTAPSFGALNVTASNGTGIAVNGSGITTSGGTVAATNGPAINATSAAFSGSLASASSTNSASQGINLATCTGTYTVGAGTISGSAGTAFNVSGGSAAFGYAGTVTVTNGQRGVFTSNVTGGSLTLGTVNVSGTGAGNDAVTLDGTGNAFDVTIASAALDTTSMRHGIALSDLGAGTDVTVSAGTITSPGAGRRVIAFTGPTNGVFAFGGVTLTATGSQGVNLGATQAGTYGFLDLDCGTPDGGVCVTVNGNAAAVTFRSVSQTGGANGIVLTSTTGSFTVTGNGGTCTVATPTCTGGTIGTSAGADGGPAGSGIWMSTASNVSLTRMRFHDHPNFAIRGQNVTSFTLDNGVVNGANGTSAASREGSVVFDGLFGSGGITNTTVSGGVEDNVRVENTTATPLTAFNVTGTGGTGSTCRILNNSTVSGNVGFRLAGFNGAVMTVTVSGCLFQGNRTDSINIDAANTASVTSTVTNNFVIAGTGGANQGNLGINVTSGGSGVHTFNVATDRVGTDGVTPAPLINTGINGFSGNTAASTLAGFFTSNTVRNAGAGSGHGIQLFQDLLSNLRANVNGNTVSNVALDFGLRVEAAGDPANPGGNVQVGVTGNNVTVLGTALDAIRVRARRQATFCSDVRTNTTNAGGAGFFGLFANQSNTATFQVEGLAAGPQTAATTQTYLVGQNPAAATLSATAVTNYVGVAVNACSIP